MIPACSAILIIQIDSMSNEIKMYHQFGGPDGVAEIQEV